MRSRYLDRSRPGCAAGIVPGKVDEHHMFGTLLLVGEKFPLKLAIFSHIAPAPSRPAMGLSSMRPPSTLTRVSGRNL